MYYASSTLVHGPMMVKNFWGKEKADADAAWKIYAWGA